VRAFDVDLVLVRRIAFRELDFLFLTMIQELGRASNAGKRQGSFACRSVNGAEQNEKTKSTVVTGVPPVGRAVAAGVSPADSRASQPTRLPLQKENQQFSD